LGLKKLAANTRLWLAVMSSANRWPSEGQRQTSPSQLDEFRRAAIRRVTISRPIAPPPETGALLSEARNCIRSLPVYIERGRATNGARSSFSEPKDLWPVFAARESGPGPTLPSLAFARHGSYQGISCRQGGGARRFKMTGADVDSHAIAIQSSENDQAGRRGTIAIGVNVYTGSPC